jgi:hypothetical protein
VRGAFGVWNLELLWSLGFGTWSFSGNVLAPGVAPSSNSRQEQEYGTCLHSRRRPD